MSEIDYAARVRRGAALLDEKWPTWAQDIDLEKLDVRSGYRCVTAQYAGSKGREPWYGTGQHLLGLDEEAYVLHGFNSEQGEDREYAALNRLWRDLIIQRREAAQPEASER